MVKYKNSGYTIDFLAISVATWSGILKVNEASRESLSRVAPPTVVPGTLRLGHSFMNLD